MKSRLLSLIATFAAIVFFANTASADTTTDKISIEDFWVVKGEKAEAKLQVSNANLYTAFQCDLFLPEGLVLAKNEQGKPIISLSGANAQSHIIECNTLTDGSIRIVAMSMSNVAFTHGEAIANITIEAGADAVGQKTIKIENARLVSVNNRTEFGAPNTQSTANVVEQRTIITAKDCTRKYGEDNPVFEYTIEGPAIDGIPEIVTEATATSPVGDYDIVVKQGTIKNTCLTFVKGKLTITKAPLIIAAGTYTKKQGNPMPEFTLTYTGFKNNETKDVLTKQPTVSCEATEASAPGEYVVTISGAEAQNYNISYTDGKLIVVAADAIIIQAKNYTREYGEVNPTFEYTVEGATLDGIPEITCEATATSPVGTYDIIVSKGTVTNYNVTYVAGTLTITKAPLTIAAGTYTKKQGEAMPEFTLTYSGFKNNETKDVLIKQPEVSCQATEASAPGEYPVIVSGAEARNYEISYTNGVLIVTEATGIAEVSVSHPVDVYTLQGNKVRTQATTLKGLPTGIYIVNGRKVRVK